MSGNMTVIMTGNPYFNIKWMGNSFVNGKTLTSFKGNWVSIVTQYSGVARVSKKDLTGTFGSLRKVDECQLSFLHTI